MSKFDAGKHTIGNLSDYKDFDDAPRGHVMADGTIRSEKRLDAQRTPRVTAARQADFDSNKLGSIGNGAFCRPGSQNRNK
jgi:hypothetical protein